MIKMKKVLITALIFLVLTGKVMAQEELPGPGITPDDWLYWLDRAVESLQKVFTFAPEDKARLSLQLAEERLAEAKAMIDKGESDLVENILGDYEDELNEAVNYGENIAELAKRKEFDELIALATSIHINVLERVLERVPEEAKGAIEKAKEFSIQGQINALRALSNQDPKKAAEISINAARSRLERAKTQANRRDTIGTKKALEDYEDISEVSHEIAEKAEEAAEIVARETIKDLEDLDEIEDTVSEESKLIVKEKKSTAVDREIKTLRSLARKNPEKAANIYSEAAKSRLNRANTKVEEAKDEVEEFKKLETFGQEISSIAQQVGKNQSKVHELVANATSAHLIVLQQVYDKVPEEAKLSVEKAMNVSATGQEKALEALGEMNPEIVQEIIAEMPEEVKEIREDIGRTEIPNVQGVTGMSGR